MMRDETNDRYLSQYLTGTSITVICGSNSKLHSTTENSTEKLATVSHNSVSVHHAPRTQNHPESQKVPDPETVAERVMRTNDD